MKKEYRNFEQAEQLPLEGFDQPISLTKPSRLDLLIAVLRSLGGYDREALDTLASAIPEPSTVISKIRDALGNKRSTNLYA